MSRSSTWVQQTVNIWQDYPDTLIPWYQLPCKLGRPVAAVTGQAMYSCARGVRRTSGWPSYAFQVFYALGVIYRNRGLSQKVCRGADTHARSQTASRGRTRLRFWRKRPHGCIIREGLFSSIVNFGGYVVRGHGSLACLSVPLLK